MNRSSVVARLLLVTGLCASANVDAEGASLQLLGDLPGGIFYSTANAISADGTTVVGSATSADGTEAFRWRAGTGMVSLGDLPDGPVASYGCGVSADGSVVVGSGTTFLLGIEVPKLMAYRWTEATGMVMLNDRAGGAQRCWATGVSADGTMVIGVGSASLGAEAVRWTWPSLTPAGLGDMTGGVFGSAAKAITPSGSIIVGSATDAFGTQGASWTAPNQISGLGVLLGGTYWSEATAVNTDGTVAAGYSIVDAGLAYEAFVWNSSDGLVGLGDLPGGVRVSKSLAISADGSRIVGFGSTDAGEEAFIWTQATGMVRLADLLTGYGIPVGNVRLEAGLGISADGRTIVGRAHNEDGNTEAYVARMPVYLCPGDVTGDGVADLADIGAMITSWDTDVTPDEARDLDGNGHIGLGDLSVVITNWGQSCGSH
ncbi:MAG TPA: hypothetical protein VG797_00870 [Phycisphaerales bacterium]|nr:hypothetical protein [Phycisphaerales bacterium]